jgi:hypothetical protein
VCISGDIGAQLVEKSQGGKQDFDFARMGRTCSWRALIFTPLCYSFYVILEVAVLAQGMRGAFTKLAVDFICFGPLVTPLIN